MTKEKTWYTEAIFRKDNQFYFFYCGISSVNQVLKASECFAKEDEGKGVDDMTKLSYLHEPGVLQNLLKRYKLNQIYVRICWLFL